MSGNDFQSWPNPADDAVVQAVARGIQDRDDRHIHTVELDYQVSGSLDDPTWAPLIQLNAVPPDTQAPPVPTGLAAPGISSSQITVSWSASTDDVGVATPQSPQSTVAAVYADAQQAGDTNIVAVGWNDTTSGITSVTDTAGNVYHPAVATFRGNGLSQAIYYAANVAASPVGGNRVTVTFGQAAAFVDLRVTEYSALSATAPFDTGASASGSGDTASSGALATAGPSELLFAAGTTGTTFTAPGPGYTSRVVTAPDGDLVADAVAQSAGSYGATASLGSGTWLLQLAAFTP
ncbi:MAG TPA: hypothetical protein VJ829_09185 [Candidatus Binatia bacterium]|nr:hypothetical protein [Candidatus Binatia bacterium]